MIIYSYNANLYNIFNLSQKGKEGIKNMENMKINGGLGIIKRITASKNDKKIAKNTFASNPFGISFKGKIQTSDLFVKSSSEGTKNTIIKKGKMAVSAAVASLVEIKNTLVQKFEPVITFAKQTADHITNLANKISDFKVENISLTAFKKETKAPTISRGAQKLLKQYKDDVNGLATLWETCDYKSVV